MGVPLECAVPDGEEHHSAVDYSSVERDAHCSVVTVLKGERNGCHYINDHH